MVSQVNVGKAFKRNAESIFLAPDHYRRPPIAVTGGINTFRRQDQDRHGAFDHFLGIEKAFHKALLLINNRSSQFGSIDPPAAHLHKMNMSVFVGLVDQFFFVIDLSHCYNGKTAQVGLDQQRLRFIVGNGKIGRAHV